MLYPEGYREWIFAGSAVGLSYNEADASMEASDGLNPVSSQGYVEVQAVEAIAMANAGQIVAPAWEE